jgi:hypothetical protein
MKMNRGTAINTVFCITLMIRKGMKANRSMPSA